MLKRLKLTSQLYKIILLICTKLPRGGYFLLNRLSKRLVYFQRFDLFVPSLSMSIESDFRNSAFFPLLKFGCYPHQVTEDKVIMEVILTRDIVVDVGANIGFVSAIMAQKVGHSGRVYSFEPSVSNFKHLSNIANVLPQIRAFNVALGNYNGFCKFNETHLSDRSYVELDRTSSGTQIRTLDSFLLEGLLTNESVSFIKIDVEGYEINVIEGARKLLCNSKPIIMFEALDEKSLQHVVDCLETIIPEYALYGINTLSKDLRRDVKRLTNNYLFVPNSKRERISSLTSLENSLVLKLR